MDQWTENNDALNELIQIAKIRRIESEFLSQDAEITLGQTAIILPRKGRRNESKVSQPKRTNLGNAVGNDVSRPTHNSSNCTNKLGATERNMVVQLSENKLLRDSPSRKHPLACPSTSKQESFPDNTTLISVESQQSLSVCTTRTSLLRKKQIDLPKRKTYCQIMIAHAANKLKYTSESAQESISKNDTRINVLHNSTNNVIRTVQSILSSPSPSTSKEEPLAEKRILIPEEAHQSSYVNTASISPLRNICSGRPKITPKQEIYFVSKKEPVAKVVKVKSRNSHKESVLQNVSGINKIMDSGNNTIKKVSGRKGRPKKKTPEPIKHEKIDKSAKKAKKVTRKTYSKKKQTVAKKKKLNNIIIPIITNTPGGIRTILPVRPTTEQKSPKKKKDVIPSLDKTINNSTDKTIRKPKKTSRRKKIGRRRKQKARKKVQKKLNDSISPMEPVATKRDLTENENQKQWTTEEVELHLMQQHLDELMEPSLTVPDQIFEMSVTSAQENIMENINLDELLTPEIVNQLHSEDGLLELFAEQGPMELFLLDSEIDYLT